MTDKELSRENELLQAVLDQANRELNGLKQQLARMPEADPDAEAITDERVREIGREVFTQEAQMIVITGPGVSGHFPTWTAANPSIATPGTNP